MPSAILQYNTEAVSSPISFPLRELEEIARRAAATKPSVAMSTTSIVGKAGRSGRICCFFGLPLIFLDFFSLHFSFVYLSCVPSATCAGYDNDKLGR
jgi:hypothetical protein